MEEKDRPKPKKNSRTLTVSPSQTQTQHPHEVEESSIPAGHKLGPYKILRQLGRGGMGAVYLAQQEKPIRRQVAIKIIKPGMDSKEIIARFESEQQALALMNHPNIAQVHDAGETDKGYPYFVMEFVPGNPITGYCDNHRLTTQERLKLFEKVCDAVQHAHFKGIVHRDLKPSNVMVAFQDENHVPKVIDFGIAKALSDEKLTEKTLKTMPGMSVGTPTYMSPEQADLSSSDIDTRTDVYSLGVMLYELLVGVPPFDRNELEKAGLMEILRIIREVAPPKPSTRFGSLGDTSTEIAKKRSTNLNAISKQLHGDLDWIVLKAIEKEQERRYNSPADLAADINRYINRDPILARPPSLAYKAKKYIRKHKAASVAAMSIVLIVILFSVWNFAERQRAERSLKEAHYNFALTLREKSSAYIKDKNWQYGKLFNANSLLYQAKARKFVSALSDLKLPLDHQDWILKNSIRTKDVMAYSLSPDGRYIASGSADSTIIIRDLTNGRETASWKASENEIASVCYSQDGKYLASGDWQSTVKIWEVPNGKEIMTLFGLVSKVKFAGPVTSLSFSPDGKYVAAGGPFHEAVQLWEASSGKVVGSLKGDYNPRASVCFSPDGKYLAFGSSDTVVKLWEISTGKVIRSFVGHQGAVISVIFSQDAKLLASASGKTIKVWGVSSGTEMMTYAGHEGMITSMSFSPNGIHLISGCSDGSVKLWNASNGEEIADFLGHEGALRAVSFHPDGKHLAIGSWESLNIWEYSEKRAIVDLKGHQEGIMQLCFSRDGEFLASADFDNKVKVWNVSSSEEIASLEGFERQVTSIDICPEGKILALTDSNALVKVYDVDSGKEIFNLSGHNGVVFSVSFSPDGKYLASGSEDKTIKTWNVSSGQMINTFKGHDGLVSSVSFSPDGKYLASGSDDKTIKIWETSKGKLSASLKGHDDDIFHVCYSPNGRHIASTSIRTIKIWDVSNGEEVSSFSGHQGQIFSASFSPDGKHVVSGSGFDFTVKVWDILSGREVTTLIGVKPVFTSVCFSPDGKRLALGILDSTKDRKKITKIRLWALDYFWNYFWLESDSPYSEKEVQSLLGKIEKQTGFVLDELTPVFTGGVAEQHK